MTAHFVLLGHPVGHSLSPAIHRRAYELLGVDGDYQLRDAPTEAVVAATIDDIRRGVLRGANVTVPHKLLALHLVDERAPSATRAGAANVLSLGAGGRVIAHNTDVLGLGDELSRERSESEALRSGRLGALVVGSGGAARAAVLAAHEAALSPVFVTARRFVGGAVEDARDEWAQLGAEVLSWPLGARLPAAVGEQLGFVIQATTAGMKGTTDGAELVRAVPLEGLPPLVVYDLVYNPEETPFLGAARASGHRVAGGLGMLVGQAARALEIWFGVRPSPEPLLRVAREALASVEPRR